MCSTIYFDIGNGSNVFYTLFSKIYNYLKQQKFN